MTRDRKGQSGREALEDIEARLGDLFGTLGNALSSVIDMANDPRMMDGHGIEKSFDVSNGPVRAGSSIRVRVGGLSKSTRTAERDVKKPLNQPRSQPHEKAQPSVREPIVDTLIDEGSWVLTAEMPGIPADAVTLEVTGSLLQITAEGAQVFRTQVEIPDGLDPDSLEHAVTNGILELRGRLSQTGSDA